MCGPSQYSENIVSKGHIDNCRLILDSSIKKIISTIVKYQKESDYFCSLKVSVHCALERNCWVFYAGACP